VRRHSGKLLAATAILGASLQLRAQLPADTKARIDSIVTKTIADKGTPSVSLVSLRTARLRMLRRTGTHALIPYCRPAWTRAMRSAPSANSFWLLP
jgi:hypothetical protein